MKRVFVDKSRRPRALVVWTEDDRMSEPGSDPPLAQLVAGSEAAFAALYDRHGPAQYRVARSLLGSREGAEDAVQDAAAKPKAIDLDNGGGKTWDCVYSLDGDTLKICAPMMPGGDRPTEVASMEGSKTRLLVLKREAKDKK
jgi:hypothetical protein